MHCTEQVLNEQRALGRSNWSEIGALPGLSGLKLPPKRARWRSGPVQAYPHSVVASASLLSTWTNGFGS